LRLRKIEVKYGRNSLLLLANEAVLIDNDSKVMVFFTEGAGREELVRALWERRDLRPILIAVGV